MQENKILAYEQTINKLNNILSKGFIKKTDDIGTTEHGFKINQYLLGNGNKNIVITGATHGCEIITTDFILNLMDGISDNYNNWKICFNCRVKHIYDYFFFFCFFIITPTS